MAVLQTKTHRKVTIVIPTYKRPGLAIKLAKQIRQLHKENFQIIIVDQKNNEPISKQEFLNYHIEYFNLSKANTSEAKNTGIKHANGDIIIFFDDDVEITKNTIMAHINTYHDLNVVGVAGKVINDSEVVPENTNVDTGKTNTLGLKFLYNFWSTKKQEVDFVYGCNMSFRKDALIKINGFDIRFNKIFEEVDLSYRMKKNGGKILFVPETLVYHHKAPSGGIRQEEENNKQTLIFKNYGLYLAKNIPFPLSLISLLFRIKTALFMCPSSVFALLKGFISFFLTKTNVLFLLLFFFAIFSRFWQVPQRFFFGIDEEYQSLLALTIIKHFHIIWIGLSAANTGFYVGPGLVYVHSLLLWISKLDPVILAYSASFIGVINTIILFFVVKALFDKKTAIISTILYSLSSYVIMYDRRFWNSTFVPLTVMLFFYSLVKFRKNSNWLIIIASLLAFSFHIHASLFIFIPICIVLILKQVLTSKVKVPIITYVLSLISFVIIYSPLIVFDLVHNYDNLKTPLRLLQNMGKGVKENLLLSHSQTMLNTLGNFLMIPDSWTIIKLLVVFIVLCLFVIFFITNTLKGKHQAFSTIISLYVIMFVLYPGKILDYYYLGFLPFLSIIITFYLKKIPSKLLVIMGIVYIGISVNNIKNIPSNSGLAYKKELISKTIKSLGNNSYYLTTNKDYLYFGGWRYLFEAYGKKPDSSQADQMFGWIYQKEMSPDKPKLKVIISDNSLILNNVIKKVTVKPYTAYILINE